jgi:type VI secretion system protein ImpL
MMTWLRNLARMLSARQWWTACGLALVLALLWTVSLWRDWTMVVPLVGTVLLLAVAMAALLLDRFRAFRTAASLEQSIRGQAEEELFSVRPERREQIEQIEREFSEAVESLKRSKVGKGQRGRAALYALPWYVVVGPPAVGKTTAINESGLDFPLGTNRVRGIGGTRNCDWFFSSDAILLDTAGRYVTVEEDRDEWLKFLDLLRLHRRRTPVNGVIVMVSIHELLQMSVDQLDDAATEMRQRINELIERLGVRFPVYLVFTKCDLLRGFVEFFDTLDRKEREQVWGCTLGRHHTDTPGEQFEREFDLLVQSLVDRRLERLTAAPTDPETAREVYLFPLEFAATRETLSQFVGRLLQPNPYQDNPDFRGFYFTSAVQTGVASDHVMRSITGSFELTSVRRDRAPAEPENRSYFLASLFSDVIIRDRNRVAPTSKMAVTRERVRRVAIAAVALVVAGFAWWSGSAFARSAREIHAAGGAVKASANPATFQDLDSLRRVITRLDRSRAASEQILRLGLDRSPSLARALRAEYTRRARPVFEAMFFRPIEARLRSGVERNARATPDTRADEKEDLRAYLLFSAELARLTTSEDSAVERPFLKGYLRRFDGMRPGDSLYTNLFVDVLDAPVVRTDSQLVAQVRKRLYVLPTVDGIYDEMMHGDAARGLRPITLASVAGGAWPTPFERSTKGVRGVFTKAGWDGYVQAAIEQWSKEPGKTDWVIGSRPDRLTSDLRDPEQLAGLLLQKYFEDYIAEWRHFLRDVRYQRLDMRTAATSLDALGDQERSPLLALIDTAIAQTRFENPAVTASRATLKPFIDRVLKVVGLQRASGAMGESVNPVDRTFAPLHALRAQGGAPFRQILAQYQTFGQMLQTIAGNPDAVSQLAMEKGRARGAIGQAAGKLDDEIRQALFEQPLDLAFNAVKRGTLDELEGGWREQVCRPYQTGLAGFYPFAPNGKDAPIKDVESFLRPRTGTLWDFYDKKLASLIKPGTFQPADAQASAVSPAIPTALRTASTIDALFFDRDELRVDFDVTPELAQVDVTAGVKAFPSQFCIRVDGQAYCSRMGYRETKPFTWPGRTGDVGAQVSATIQTQDHRALPLRPLESPGPWGWFRLLDRAQLTNEHGETFATWLLEEPGRYKVQVKFKLTPKGGRNPLDDTNRRLFSRFTCLSSLR